jgi:hypothetical protein
MSIAATGDSAELVSIRDEVLRRIGRNVVLFQELERILKFLAVAHYFSAPVSKLQEDHDGRVASVREHTLGQLTGRLLDKLHASAATQSSSAMDTIAEPWVTFAFQIEAAADSIETSRNSLSALVKERNGLIHHLLACWNPHDVGSCHALGAELDEQRSRIVLEIERYRAYANGLKELAKEFQAFIESDGGKKQFDLAFLQQSRMAILLASIANEHARKDGWTLLSTAGHHLRQLIPDEFARMKDAHGEGSLQKLVIATGLFDVAIEQIPEGGTRALYRNRAELEA